MAGSCLCKRYDLIWIVERDVYDTLVEIFIHLKTDDQRVVKQTVWLFQPWCSVRRQLWTLTRTQPPPDTINRWQWVCGVGQTVAWEIHLHPQPPRDTFNKQLQRCGGLDSNMVDPPSSSRYSRRPYFTLPHHTIRLPPADDIQCSSQLLKAVHMCMAPSTSSREGVESNMKDLHTSAIYWVNDHARIQIQLTNCSPRGHLCAGCSKPVSALQQISRKPRKTVLMHF